ncbi:MAG: conserved phage C-terminal domain-containing protein [Anaeroglobus sp.]
MAERRMMAKSIIKSDLFLDMPATTQNLYFHMLLEADDDGFINSPKSIMRVIGAKDDDIKVLIAKQFVIPFESGVLVIKHWKIHNYIQKDRYRPSLRPEKEMLSVAESKEYVEVLGDVSSMDTRCIQNVRVGKVSIGKSRLGKSSIGKNTYSPSLPSVAEDIVSHLNSVTGSSYRSTTDKTRKLIAARLAEGFTVDDFKAVISKKAKEWQGTDMAQYLRPETLFGTKFEGYLNQPEVRNNRRSPLSRAEQERQEAINVVNELIAEYEEEERQNGQGKHDESNSTASIGF